MTEEDIEEQFVMLLSNMSVKSYNSFRKEWEKAQLEIKRKNRMASIITIKMMSLQELDTRWKQTKDQVMQVPYTNTRNKSYASALTNSMRHNDESDEEEIGSGEEQDQRRQKPVDGRYGRHRQS